MECIWTAKVDAALNKMVIRQSGYIMKVPMCEFSRMDKIRLMSDHECQGCHSLPLNGRQSRKFKWCRVSLCILGLHEKGYRFLREDQIGELSAILEDDAEFVDLGSRSNIKSSSAA